VPLARRKLYDVRDVASRLADDGFAVVAVDFRGHGDSGGAVGAKGLDGLRLDVKAAKGFLRERPEVVASVLGEAGASIGANLAVLDAADDPAVRSIALLSPGLDYRGLRIEAAMKKFGARSALLASSTKDLYSARSIRELVLIGPGPREVRFSESVAHGTTMLARDADLIGALVDWFRRTLL
jgi:alpha-beta hydrolase superfamily lysophospholipase